MSGSFSEESVDVVQEEFRQVFEEIQEEENGNCRRKTVLESRPSEPIDNKPFFWYDNKGGLHSNLVLLE